MSADQGREDASWIPVAVGALGRSSLGLGGPVDAGAASSVSGASSNETMSNVHADRDPGESVDEVRENSEIGRDPADQPSRNPAAFLSNSLSRWHGGYLEWCD
jgi:hypothetical protein